MELAPESAPERFTRLWVETQPAVSAYLAALVPNFQDAQDLLQKTALTALRKIETYDSNRSFTNWCLGIARFETLHFRRSQARSPLILSDQLNELLTIDAEELHDEFDLRTRHLADCLQQLEGRPADLIRFRYQDDLGPAAIAERLQISPGAARVALNRVRTWLRTCIESKLSPQ